MKSSRIQLIFFDAGGGHRAAAEALGAALAERYPRWRVEIINLQEVLKSADPLFILTGKPAQDYYNAALKMGLTYGSRPFLRGLQSLIKLCASRIEEVLREHWKNSGDIDAVVSLIPNFNRVMFRSLRAVCPHTPYVTIMTDMADSPPHFWQEKQDQYIICGTALAARQARETGWYRPERIFETSGMILRPSFYQNTATITRGDLGLAEDKMTAIIMFGGYGSKDAKLIVEKLAKSKLDIQSIVMCGRNDELRAALQNMPSCHAVGYTRDVAAHMRLADFFIGKPGPGSISEAWHMGLPVIVERNAATMIQERPNVVVIEQTGTGVAVGSFRSIARTVHAMIADGRLEAMRANVAHLDNRAVFEIPDILNHIMAQPADMAQVVPLKPRRRRIVRLARRWAGRRKRKSA